MSVRLMGVVWQTELPKNLKMLLLALADHANDDGAGIYPGVARLADKTSDSERNVRRLLAELEDRGLIEAVAYRAGGHGMATHWRIVIAELYRAGPAPRRRPRDTGAREP